MSDVPYPPNGQSRGSYGYTRDVAGRITSMNVDGAARNFDQGGKGDITL